ncbi:MAG TPA: SRPBCC family protein [Euzebyales bacterium]
MTRDDELMPRDGRWAVRLERRLSHPIDRVWQAITQTDHLNVWFPAHVAGEMRTGGQLTFTFGDTADEPATHGTVLQADPPDLLVYTWDDNELRFELTPDGDATLLVLVNTFDDRPGAASFATGWGLCLAALDPVLRGAPVPGPADPRGVARHEELVRRFGLDQPDVTEDAGEWQVRFERQLTCAADVAWDLFLGRDPQTGQQRTAPDVGSPLNPFATPHVVLGTVTEVAAPSVLAFDTAPGEPGDHVRLELVEGTGHGARLVLTITGRSDHPDERQAAIDQWGPGAVEHVAREGAARAAAHIPA